MIAGCSVSGGLSRRNASAMLLHSTKVQRENYRQEPQPSYMKIEHPDGRPPEYLIPTTTLDNGEQVMSIQLDEVVVVAKSRTLPERMGRVGVEFVITLPKALQGSCRNIVVTPVLHNRGERTPLEEVAIRGALFNKVQIRDYWQYNKYLGLYKPDSLKAE